MAIEKKSKKKHIRFKGLIIVILFLYLLGSIIYSIVTSPIKEINITGNYYLKDNYIIDYLDINEKSIIAVNKKDVKNKLLALDLISGVSISKNYLGKLNIEIEEDKILFYNGNNNKIILSSGKEIDYNSNYLGVPSLINIVPDTVYEELIQKLKNIDRDIISLISEIEYSPSIVEGKTVDEKRFIFRMNDSNIVYVNTTNMEKFNEYLSLYEVISNKNGDVTGCLYLDSNSDNIHFNTDCIEIEEVEVNEE